MAKLPRIKKDQLSYLKMRPKNENTKGKSQLKLHELFEYCELRKIIPENDQEVFWGDFVIIKRMVTFNLFAIKRSMALKCNLYF